MFEEIHLDAEKFYFYLNAGFSKEEAVEILNQNFDLEKELLREKTISLEGTGISTNGNQLIIERDNDFISVKYIKNLE